MKPYFKIIKSQLKLKLPEAPVFKSRRIKEGDDLLTKAKQLHASVYLKRNYIDPEEVDSNGVIHEKSDPHQKHSDYFVITDHENPETVLATARQIRAVNGHNDLPVLTKARINGSHRSQLLALPHENMIEISGLAKASGVSSAAVIELYRAMWQHSKQQKHAYWLMACDVRLFKKLKILFGKSIHKIGRRTHYKGGDIIPCVVNLDEAHKIIEKHHNSRHPIYRNVRRRVASYFMPKEPAK